MALFTPTDREFAEAVAGLVYCNPFLPERIEFERRALGPDFVETRADWNVNLESHGMHPNIIRLRERAEALTRRTREWLADGARTSGEELGLYEAMVLFMLFHKYLEEIQATVDQALARPGQRETIALYPAFEREMQSLLEIPGVRFADPMTPDHLFASFFQLRRAFHHIFTNIIGISRPAIRLRAMVWQSIFTHDMKRYRRVLYNRMGDVTCLITGPSGTGKELVARAIGLSRYVPFDAKSRTFTEDVRGSFHAVNLSALAPTLIESELFGHRRGAFTGALQDRAGWLEVCRPLGTVFLDEIGEVDQAIQVKLLRVLQTRTFQRLGDTEDRRFEGKIIAATNRNLAREMREQRFREDLYYRLCSDIIATPSLHEQIQDQPGELWNLTLFIARRLVGEAEAESLAREVRAYIDTQLGRGYRWPGNVRELEQCVRNVMIRQAYEPPRVRAATARDRFAEAVRNADLTAEELLRGYCTLVYAETGNYQETARRLQLDHRTIKSRIESSLLDAFRGEKSP